MESPVGDFDQAFGEERNVKAKMCGAGFGGFLIFGKQVEEESADAMVLEDGCDEAVAGAFATAATAVGEENKAEGIFRDDEIAAKREAADGNVEIEGRFWRQGVHHDSSRDEFSRFCSSCRNGSDRLLRLGGNVSAEEGAGREIEDEVVWRSGDFQ